MYSGDILFHTTVILVAQGGTPPAMTCSTESLAVRLRGRGRLADVRLAYVRAEPHLGDVLAGVPGGARVVIVPHFAADGLFADDIARAHRHRFPHLEVLRPLALQPALLQPVSAALEAWGPPVTGPDVLVLGHSAPQGGQSAGAALALGWRLRSLHPERQVVELLKGAQTPPDAWRGLAVGDDLLVVPMFAGDGLGHDGATRSWLARGFGLPQAARLPDTPVWHGGRRVAFVSPLEDLEFLAALVERLAQAKESPLTEDRASTS